MKKGEGSSESKEYRRRKMAGQDMIKNKTKMKKNMQRLGGKGGLSLESFANAKNKNPNYNPSLFKKQREFYRNAKYLQKYKRSLKRHEHPNLALTDERPAEVENGTREGDYVNHHKNSKKNTRSLGELYEKNREEEEKARMEREAMIQAKKEERQQAEARRRALKEKMYKKTKSGQPVMKYRIEHLLETIQGPTS